MSTQRDPHRTITLHCRDTEHIAVLAAAASEGMGVSTWLRSRLALATDIFRSKRLQNPIAENSSVPQPDHTNWAGGGPVAMLLTGDVIKELSRVAAKKNMRADELCTLILTTVAKQNLFFSIFEAERKIKKATNGAETSPGVSSRA